VATTSQAVPAQPAAETLPQAGGRFQALGVITVSAAHFVHDTYSAFFAILLPVLIENLAITKTAAGVWSVFYNLPSLFQPLIGHLGDRHNLRMLVVLAPALTAAMMTLMGVAPTYAVVTLLLVVAGASSAGLHAVGPVIGGLLSGNRLGRGMSFWMVGGELGRTLGPLIVVAGLAALTARGLPWLMLGGAAASLLLYLRLRHVPEFHPNGGNGQEAGAALRQMGPLLLPVATVVTARALLFAAITTFLPTFLTEEGSSLWLAGASLSVMQAAGVAGALAGGVVSDRFGRRRVVLLMTLAAPLAVLAFLNVGGWLHFPLLLLIGLTLLSTGPVMMALVQERARENRALANGIFMALNFITMSLAVVLVGALGDRFGLRAAIYTSALVMLAGLPFVFWLPKDM
jgi:FSR family fosmidomycin resistance protein-like MFS transporter